jgi:hypothetical protein
MLLVDSKGMIAGLGRIEVSVKDIARGRIGKKNGHDQWHGELKPDTTGEVTAYILVDHGHRACAVGRATAEANGTRG